jgi:hypothetical protein
MFDRYAGDNNTALPTEQKLYLGPDKTIVLPSENIMSFLTSTNTTSAPKRLLDARQYREVCAAFQCFVDIKPVDVIPFLRNGKPIRLGRIEEDVDKSSGVWVHRSVARLPKGIPNPKARPVLPLPWSLEFVLTLHKNNEANAEQLQKMFDEGGITIGLGTFRGRYGKFVVGKWERI